MFHVALSIVTLPTRTSRKAERTKLIQYQKLKPSKCQLKLPVETVTPQLEKESQAEPQPNKFQPSNSPKCSTPDVAKPPHSVKLSPNTLKSLPNSKGVKKRKSVSPSKERKMTEREDKGKEKKVGEERKQKGKEGTEEAEGKPL